MELFRRKGEVRKCMSRRRKSANQMVTAVMFTFAFLWSVLLALIALGGAFVVAIVLSILGGVGLAWLHEHV